MSGAGRTAAIMQPTWLPYLGYFQLIAAADVFVFLDDVQFARRSWQSRNRILDPAGQEVLLSVGLKKQSRDTAILDIEIDDARPWRADQLAAIRAAYAASPHFADGFAFLEDQLARPESRLADLTCGLIEAAARQAGLSTPFVRASTLGCGGVRSDHLLAVCRAVEATDYLSPTGSADYIAQDAVFADAGFPVAFRTFAERPYPQSQGEPFIPFMSFVDALMNVGWRGLRDLVRP